LATEDAERRNRALLDAIPDSMFRIRVDGTYVDFHSNQPGSLTLPPDRIVGANVADHMPPDEAALRLDAIKRVVESRARRELRAPGRRQHRGSRRSGSPDGEERRGRGARDHP
jgi:PAS domain-containing protein